MNAPTIGARIQEARKAAGFRSRSLFAREQLRIDPAQLYMYETNRRTPRIDMLVRIARACRVTLDELVSDASQGTPVPPEAA